MNIPINHLNHAAETQDWYLLAEYPLNELLADIETRDKPESGLLFQAISVLGVPPELLDIIEKKLIGFSVEAPVQLNQQGCESLTCVRLFCQRKAIKEIISSNTSSQPRTRQINISSSIVHQSDSKTNGGWGYFLVERGGGFAPNSTVSIYNLVDLYLYKEGE